MASLSGQLTFRLWYYFVCFCGVGFHVAFDGSLPEKVAYRVMASLSGQKVAYKVMASLSGQLTFCLGYLFLPSRFLWCAWSTVSWTSCIYSDGKLEWATDLLSRLFVFFYEVGFYVALDASFPEQVAYKVMASLSGQLTLCLGCTIFEM